MSDIVDKLDWLSDVAQQADKPPLFGREAFFSRLRAETTEEYFSLRLFAGIGAASAIAAGVIFHFAMSAWADLSDPLAHGIQTILEVML